MKRIFQQILFGQELEPEDIDCPDGCNTSDDPDDTFFCKRKLDGNCECDCIIDTSIYSGLKSIFRAFKINLEVQQNGADMYYKYGVGASDDYNITKHSVMSFKKDKPRN